MILCPVHRQYKAKREPKVFCEACWRAWIEEQDSRQWVSYAKQLLGRKQ